MRFANNTFFKPTVRYIALQFIAMSLLLGACSVESPKLLAREIQKKENLVQKGANKDTFNPQVDILFVIANDSSMAEYQANLSTNIKAFTSEILKNQFLDFHIGVINAMDYDQRRGPWGGRLVGTPTFVTRATPNTDAAIISNLKMGSMADDPVALFKVVRLALTPPVSMTENIGFLRQDAALAVMFMSDTDPEESSETADSMYKLLLSLKGGDAKKIAIYAAYNNDPNLCRGENPPIELDRLLDLFKGSSQGFSLCDSNYGAKLAAISTNIIKSVGRVMYLKRLPDVSTIVVTYAGYTVPNNADTGWSYDPERNAIVFGEDLNLPPNAPAGSTMQVNFTAADAN